MRVPKRASKRSVNYQLEAMEQRVLLSAALTPAQLERAIPSIEMFHNPVPFKPLIGGGGLASPIGLTPQQVVGAYAANDILLRGGIVGTGAGQTIALVDAYDWPTAQADLTGFDQAFGLPDPPSFIKLNQEGLTGPLPPVDPASFASSDDWEGEESLDVEWAHVMAPQANLVLVEANSDQGDNLYLAASAAARTPGVSVVSMSFGFDETPSQAAEDSIFVTPPGHINVTFLASAGDNGIFSDVNPTEISPSYPASSPNVVAVGGTNLVVNGNNTYGSETGWGDGAASGVDGGTGGGTSTFEPEPAYQHFLATQSSTMRNLPDVSILADPATGVPVYDTFDNGATTPWTDGPIGGTSLASPLWAGLIAIADQGRVLNGFGTLDGAKETLPHLYDLPSHDFHDITVGNNGDAAGVGYDLVTGRGTPIANLLVPDLASGYVGSYFFNDTNFNGIQDTGEAGIPGATVSLKTPGTDGIVGTNDDQTIQTTTTDQFGLYEFTGLTAGSYYVQFTLPTGFGFSPVGTSSIGVEDSLVNPKTGDTGVISLSQISEYNLANAGAFEQSISINDVTVTRPHSGLAPMVFTVTLAPVNISPTTVPFTTVNGTATVANNDYLPQSGTLVFPAGVTQETITVEAVGNLTIENNVSFTVVVTPPVGYDPVKPVGTGTILNSNFPVATVSGPAPMTRSALTPITFPFVISLSAPAPFVVSVPYTTVDQSAVSGVDYVGQTASQSFPAGITTETVFISVFAGTNRQLDKTFLFQLTTPVAPITNTVGTPSQATGTILTNELPAVNADPGEVTESLTGLAYLPFTVDVAPSLNESFTVNYSTADGTAIAGRDYQAQSGTLSFGPGRVQQTVYVPVYQQFIAQQDKTLTFTISNPSTAIDLVSPTVTGTIHYLALAAIPFSSTLHATYTDSLNQKVTVTMKGVGSGDVVFLGSISNFTNAFEIEINGTSTASSATITVPRNRQTSLTNLIVSSPIGTINAKSTNIVGSVTAASSIKSLQLGYVEASTITIGGAGSGAAVLLSFNRVVNSTITSAISITSLTANAYVNTTGSPIYVTAPSVGAVKVKGNFGGTISTTAVQTQVASAVKEVFSNSLISETKKKKKN